MQALTNDTLVSHQVLTFHMVSFRIFSFRIRKLDQSSRMRRTHTKDLHYLANYFGSPKIQSIYIVPLLGQNHQYRIPLLLNLDCPKALARFAVLYQAPTLNL